METTEVTDTKAQRLEKALKYGGVAAVAVVASTVVIASAGSVIIAGAALAGAIITVNALPVVARWAALRKQRALTALDEEFSEENIRKDEEQEGRRIREQQQLYAQQEAEFQNIIDELRTNMARATSEERALLQSQIDELQGILAAAYESLQHKVADFEELKRVNPLYISLNRAAKAMKRGKELERTTAQIQSIETSRRAIKTRMREAMAGQRLEAMNAPLRQRLSVSSAAQIAAPASSLNTINMEAQRVPIR